MKQHYKSKILVLIISLIYSINFSQIIIKGTVISNDNSPISFANIFIKDTLNNKILASTNSDSIGNFVINIDNNSKNSIIYIKFSTLIPFSKKISSSEDLGRIILYEKQLKEVQIMGRKPVIINKVDRLVFDVESSILANSGSAYDILKYTPKVLIDETSISIIGKSSVTVMINDIPSTLTDDDLIMLLRSIPSDNVKNIEVISNPPSKYSAEGKGGLINIVIKNAKENNWKNIININYLQNYFASYMGSNTFMYNKNKLSFSLTASITNHKRYETVFSSQLIPNNINYQNNISTYQFKPSRYNAIFNYDLSTKNSVGANIQVHFGSFDLNSESNVDIINNNNIITKSYYNSNQKEFSRDNYSSNIFFIHKFDSNNSNMKAYIDIIKSSFIGNNYLSQYNDYFFQLDDTVKNESYNNNKILNYDFGLDFEHKFKNFNFNYGAKYSNSFNNSNINFYNTEKENKILDSTKSDNFDFNEDILGIYSELLKDINKKLQLKVGIRYEYSHTKGNSHTTMLNNSNEYGKFFPSIYLNYIYDKNNNFNINYSRRIKRPHYRALNPFRYYFSDNNYESGNPFLMPVFSNNYELTHNYKNKFISTFNINLSENEYDNLNIYDTITQSINKTWDNYGNIFGMSIIESINIEVTKFWTTYNQIYLTYHKAIINEKYSDKILIDNIISSAIQNKNSFIIKNVNLELNLNYNFPSYRATNKINSHFEYNFGINYKLFDKKLDITTKFSNFFLPNYLKSNSYIDGIYQEYNSYLDNKQLMISLKYIFGNKKINSKMSKSTNQEEMNRINN